MLQIEKNRKKISKVDGHLGNMEYTSIEVEIEISTCEF